jgi:uncharacterized membrane protein YfcA
VGKSDGAVRRALATPPGLFDRDLLGRRRPRLLAQLAAHGQLLLVSSIAIFLAAVVRGFSGFGFSLLAITAISIFMPAQEIVPSIFLLEVAASLNLIPSIWREIDWRGIAFLILGYVIGLVPGIYALVHAPAAPLNIALGLFVIVTSLVMLSGFRLQKTPGPPAIVATGVASGLLNGAFGTGGPPVVLFYFSTPAAAAVGRASIIAFFFLTDTLGLIGQAYSGIITTQSFVQFIAWIPALLVGVAIGAKGFKHMEQVKFRKAVLIILIGLAVVTLVKAGLDLAHSA